jgi:hypothetical protein
MSAHSERGARKWHLGTYLVNLSGGGIVHAYPGARFLSAMYYENERVLITFLDRAPPDSTNDARPNADEVEYLVRIFAAGEDMDDPVPEFIGAFSHSLSAYVAFVEPRY